MDEKKTNAAAEAENITPEERKKRAEEYMEALKKQLEERNAKQKIANEAIQEGKGKLTLETPIKAGDEEITELTYDFTVLTGMEYAAAMDSDSNAQQVFRITDRQSLALFARAASKQTPRVDTTDIIERIGMTDAVVAIQLATFFFSASARAGQLRISKKS